jgi:hypothetical protein
MAVNNGDILRLEAKMVDDYGTDLVNTFHMQYSGPTEDDVTVFGAARGWLEDMYNTIDVWMPDSTVFESIIGFNVTQGIPLGEEPWLTVTTGEATGDPLAPQLAPLIRFVTKVAKSQGRKYLPYLTEASSELFGLVSGTTLTSMISYAAQAVQDRVAGEGTMSMGNWNSDLARFAEWTSAIVDTAMRTQRRRFPGVGS